MSKFVLLLLLALTAFAANAGVCCCMGGIEPQPASCCGSSTDDFQLPCDCEFPCMTNAWSAPDMLIVSAAFPHSSNHSIEAGIDTDESVISDDALFDQPATGPPLPLRIRLARLQVWRN